MSAGRRLLLIVLAAALAVLAVPAAASACERGWRCGTVTVPLARDGSDLGTIALPVWRLPARSAARRGVIVALAGGPGESAIDLRHGFARGLRGALRDHDLVVFDQRGTGGAGRLDCGDAASCAAALGPAAGWYTSADSADDLDAVRAAVGAERVSVYGVSYGTVVARAYARRHPQRVERLVLDSVEPDPIDDPFHLEVVRAVPRILRATCAHGRCAAGVRPVAALERLMRRLRSGDLMGTDVDHRGRRHAVSFAREDVFEVLMEGDFYAPVRGALPAALRSAARGDYAPLARAVASTRLGGGQTAEEGFSASVLEITSCSEQRMPWSDADSELARRQAVLRAARAIPEAAFRPLDRISAVRNAGWPASCIEWPLPRREMPRGPLPDVPVLLLEGAQDLRTPLENARRGAAAFPRARLLVFEDVAHAVLASDTTGCAARAAARFFAGRPVPACRLRARDRWRVAPVVPRQLADVVPRAGRSRIATAVELTVQDTLAQVPPPAQLADGLRFGGLRGGRVRVAGGRARLHRVVAVGGLEVSGTVTLATASGVLDVRARGTSRLVRVVRGTVRP